MLFSLTLLKQEKAVRQIALQFHAVALFFHQLLDISDKEVEYLHVRR